MRKITALFAAAVCLALTAPAPASSAKSNVGTVLKKIDVKYIKNKPEKTIGQPMIVEFWATWCPPCRASIPHLNEVFKKFKDKGLVVVGITDEDDNLVEKFMKQVPMDYAVAQDKGDDWGKQFGIKGIPHALLVDKSGKIVWEGHPMELDEKEIEKIL